MDLNECLAEDSGCSSFKHGGCEPDESYKIKELYLDLDDCNVRYHSYDLIYSGKFFLKTCEIQYINQFDFLTQIFE